MQNSLMFEKNQSHNDVKSKPGAYFVQVLLVFWQALHIDVMRSLMARCELLYEDVIDVVEEESGMLTIVTTKIKNQK